MPDDTAGIPGFIRAAADDSTYFRSIVLFGTNTASYKFALSRALLVLAAEGRSRVTLSELAPYFTAPLLAHVQRGKRQGTVPSSVFLEGAAAHLHGQLDADAFHALTVRHAFRYVLDVYHRLPGGETATEFFQLERGRSRTLVLTDALLALSPIERELLEAEAEARWDLVEHAWTEESAVVMSGRSPTYEEASGELVLVPWRHQTRVSLTRLRPALSGYQKGHCFYCYQPVDMTSGEACHVDHVFPWVLGYRLPDVDLNAVWNLVLSCETCNAGPGGKADAIPARRFLERLHRRNSYLIDSHHPLQAALMRDTGSTAKTRWAFLTSMEAFALEQRTKRWDGRAEHPPVF
ncbi:HNH endonuclease [Deinococcus marmoris]|uniref:HNH endonuclease n=1 Tax=Deinococcus marmoris TaxID=249408 RepID=UPI00096AAB2A|nr:HNH endonuclease signature motif containing protein [Deinococcus marmoris]